MEIDKDRVKARFQSMSEEELIDAHFQGGLVEEAVELLHSELRKRGISEPDDYRLDYQERCYQARQELQAQERRMEQEHRKVQAVQNWFIRGFCGLLFFIGLLILWREGDSSGLMAMLFSLVLIPLLRVYAHLKHQIWKGLAALINQPDK